MGGRHACREGGNKGLATRAGGGAGGIFVRAGVFLTRQRPGVLRGGGVSYYVCVYVYGRPGAK